MATVRPFQVNNGLDVNVNANVVGNTTSLDFIANTTGSTLAPVVVFDFVRTKSIDSRLNFTRASSATYRAANGYVAYASINTPRFNFNSNGVCLGLLFENFSTNDVLYSTNIGNTNSYNLQEGSAGSLGMTLNADVAPDGSNTATYLYHSSSTPSFKNVNIGFNILTNRIYTSSVWVKSNNQPDFALTHFDATDGINTISITYTFATNTFVTSVGSSSNCAIIGTPLIEPYRNSWYRINYSYHYTAGPSIRSLTLKYELGSTSTTVNSGVYFWGAQNENADKVTSFIPTSTASATRVPDYLYCIDDVNNKKLTSWLNVSQGTIAAEWNATIGPTNNSIATLYSSYPGPYVFWNANGTGNDVLTHLFYVDASSNKPIAIESFNNGIFSLSSLSNANVSSDVTYKSTVGYSTTEHVISVNGSSIASAVPSQSLPPTNRLDIGRSRALPLTGHVRNFKYWPIKLSNTNIINSTL